MKICQVHPGILPIPRKNYGAVESVIWEYKKALENRGHTVDIKYPNEINPGDYDIVHCHTWNQTILLAEKDIPVINHLHDHHTVLWGTNSDCYKQNLEAINKSLLTLVPAEFLINHFGNPYKIFYLSHGVNTNDYKPSKQIPEKATLLCVANNGYADNPTADRKGFRLAVEAAKKFDLAITIAGPSKNNEAFFRANRDLLNYSKLKVIYDLPDDELKALYARHTVFLHPSELEAGHPNLTLLEAMASGLPVVGAFKGSRDLPGLKRVDLTLDSVANGLEEVLSNYLDYRSAAIETARRLDYSNVSVSLEKIYSGVKNREINFSPALFKTALHHLYTVDIPKKSNAVLPIKPDEVSLNFINGAYVEIKGMSTKTYAVEFIDRKSDQIIYQTTMKPGTWAKTNISYFIDYDIRIKHNGKLFARHLFDASNKRVYIHIDSKALGDTLAWFPYIEEFQKKHHCEIICSTFWNDLFIQKYPNFTFVPPGSTVQNLYAMYTLGLFDPNNPNSHPIDPRKVPLQKIATDLLGLNYREETPRIFVRDTSRPIKDKYVAISANSTAQAKFWNYDGGWQILIDYLNGLEYKVVLIQKEETDLKNVINLKTKDIQESINYLIHCDFFIGLSSGISWLAHALGKKVVMISGFTAPWNEFQTNIIRINNEFVCNGCWNDSNYKFDPGDWLFCPKHKGTNKSFECTKSITPENVIKILKSHKLV